MTVGPRVGTVSGHAAGGGRRGSSCPSPSSRRKPGCRPASARQPLAIRAPAVVPVKAGTQSFRIGARRLGFPPARESQRGWSSPCMATRIAGRAAMTVDEDSEQRRPIGGSPLPRHPPNDEPFGEGCHGPEPGTAPTRIPPCSPSARSPTSKPSNARPTRRRSQPARRTDSSHLQPSGSRTAMRSSSCRPASSTRRPNAPATPSCWPTSTAPPISFAASESVRRTRWRCWRRTFRPPTRRSGARSWRDAPVRSTTCCSPSTSPRCSRPAAPSCWWCWVPRLNSTCGPPRARCWRCIRCHCWCCVPRAARCPRASTSPRPCANSPTRCSSHP